MFSGAKRESTKYGRSAVKEEVQDLEHECNSERIAKGVELFLRRNILILARGMSAFAEQHDLGREGQPTEFTASSTCYCNVCKVNIKIACGGKGNWNIHTASIAHKEKEEAVNNVRDNKGITAFFQKAVHKSSAVTTSSSTSTSILSPSHIEPPSMPPPSIPDAIVIPDTLPFPQHNSSTIFYLDSSCPSSTSLLCQLKLVTASLLPSIPEGELSDVLAQFSGNPAFDPGDNAWEMVDQALNQVIGFGMSAEEVSKVVHRGSLGMDGMCRWLRLAISELKVEEILLEGKIRRLIEAMILVGGTTAPSIAPSAPKPAERVPEIPRSAAKPPAKSAMVACPGYTIKFADGHSTYDEYCFQIHGKKPLPWTFRDTGKELILCSNTCSRAVHISSKCKQKAPSPCSACANIRNHDIILGMLHCSDKSVHPSTPWGFLGAHHLQESLRKKSIKNNQLKLQALNTAQKIVEDIPRIRSLMVMQHRAGASVFTILEKIDKAARRAYSPKGYQIADFQHTFLIYKLGGRAAADITHHSLGTPSIDATKCHIITAPLQSSSGFPTSAELSANLAVCYPPLPPSLSSDRQIQGMTMEVDELKIQERLQWDPRSDNILGVC
ncbi:hypothetical protein CPB84DRAFT_1742605 [Gymnopilus junonius]|uniref:Uncharacterized protein n=1 Tax=Gymnopilus junonius TaxID=109634 RepID=A0A9P5P172_GYMJU|nr:hypothetical protein CPB84DRAFT_1742605 [Gymnopilus junonius]